MKRIIVYQFLILGLLQMALAGDDKDEKNSNLKQYYSGKFGFYQPSDGLNNGLLLGIDGITEFIHHNFFLSGAIDLYPKQTFSFFRNPQPDVERQQIILLPLHINFGYKVFDVEDMDSRGYLGFGGGYYFYFYSVDYRSGGLLGTSIQSDSKTGGNVFATLFARVLIGKIFIEPRFYIASKSEDSVGGANYVVNPSGFAITLGFQYH